MENTTNNREVSWKLEKIQYFEAKIKEEKESIIDCVKNNMFCFVNAKIQRIKEMQQLIIELKCN